MTPLWQFLALLAVHWIADFVLQTHWQAQNKSKRLDALAQHVAVYTSALLFAVPFIAPQAGYRMWLAFILVNGAMHFVTDYFTSRWSSKHFGPAIRDTHRVMTYTDSHGVAPDAANMRLMAANPGHHYHNFFVVIGFDQLIHQATLAATMAWLFY